MVLLGVTMKEIKNVLFKGDKVKMVDCLEARGREDVVWTCQTDSFKSCSGHEVVFLENFSGYFLTEFLQRVKA